jgi:hypothetical protein
LKKGSDLPEWHLYSHTKGHFSLRLAWFWTIVPGIWTSVLLVASLDTMRVKLGLATSLNVTSLRSTCP